MSSIFSSWDIILQHKEILRFVHDLSGDRNTVPNLIAATITVMPFFYTDTYVERIKEILKDPSRYEMSIRPVVYENPDVDKKVTHFVEADDDASFKAASPTIQDVSTIRLILHVNCPNLLSQTMNQIRCSLISRFSHVMSLVPIGHLLRLLMIWFRKVR